MSGDAADELAVWKAERSRKNADELAFWTKEAERMNELAFWRNEAEKSQESQSSAPKVTPRSAASSGRHLQADEELTFWRRHAEIGRGSPVGIRDYGSEKRRNNKGTRSAVPKNPPVATANRDSIPLWRPEGGAGNDIPPHARRPPPAFAPPGYGGAAPPMPRPLSTTGAAARQIYDLAYGLEMPIPVATSAQTITTQPKQLPKSSPSEHPIPPTPSLRGIFKAPPTATYTPAVQDHWNDVPARSNNTAESSGQGQDYWNQPTTNTQTTRPDEGDSECTTISDENHQTSILERHRQRQRQRGELILAMREYEQSQGGCAAKRRAAEAVGTQPLGSDIDWEKEQANTFAIRMDMYWQLKFARQARSIDEASDQVEEMTDASDKKKSEAESRKNQDQDERQSGRNPSTEGMESSCPAITEQQAAQEEQEAEEDRRMRPKDNLSEATDERQNPNDTNDTYDTTTT